MAKDPDRIIYLPNRREVLMKGMAARWPSWGPSRGRAPSSPDRRGGLRRDSRPGGRSVLGGRTAREGGRPARQHDRRLSARPPVVPGPHPLPTLRHGPLHDHPAGRRQGGYLELQPRRPLFGRGVAGHLLGGFPCGYQITNGHGIVEFLTSYPGWYSGRTVHVHIRVRTYNEDGNVTYDLATQLFFAESITAQVYALEPYATRAASRNTYNATDRVFTGRSYNGSPESDAGDYTLLKLANDGSHVMGSMHIVVDLSDTADEDPTGGTEGGGGGGHRVAAALHPEVAAVHRVAAVLHPEVAAVHPGAAVLHPESADHFMAMASPRSRSVRAEMPGNLESERSAEDRRTEPAPTKPASRSGSLSRGETLGLTRLNPQSEIENLRCEFQRAGRGIRGVSDATTSSHAPGRRVRRPLAWARA